MLVLWDALVLLGLHETSLIQVILFLIKLYFGLLAERREDLLRSKLLFRHVSIVSLKLIVALELELVIWTQKFFMKDLRDVLLLSFGFSSDLFLHVFGHLLLDYLLDDFRVLEVEARNHVLGCFDVVLEVVGGRGGVGTEGPDFVEISRFL